MARHRIQMTDDMRKLGSSVAVIYAARQAKVCVAEGRTDNGGRWYPSERENSDGYTDGKRPPSRRWGWSYLKASKSRPHVVGLALSNPAYLAECAAKAIARNVVVTEKQAAAAARAILKIHRADADEDDREAARLVRVAKAAEQAEATAAKAAAQFEADTADAAFKTAIEEDWRRLNNAVN